MTKLNTSLPIDYSAVEKVFIPCACCGSKEFFPAFTGDRHGLGLQTVVCKTCGLIFTNPRPSPEWFEEFYSLHYRKFYESVEKPDSDYLLRDWVTGRHSRNAAFLEKYLPKVGKLFDIGCAEGTFMHEFIKRFKDWDVEGLEPSIDLSNFARQHYSLSKVRTGSVRELNAFFKNHYDLITLNHVLEHMLNPGELLQEIHSLLRPNGILFVDVPDAEGVATV